MTAEQVADSTDRLPRLAALVDSPRFNGAIALVIVANAILLGWDTYPDLTEQTRQALDIANTVFYGVFVVELLLRMASYAPRPTSFFRAPWNVFDFVIIAAVLIPGVRHHAMLLRVFRLARLARLVRLIPEARVLMVTILRSIPSALSMIVLALFIIYIYGMLGWMLFGEELPQTWGTIGSAMKTLFVLLTMENFPSYLDEAQQASPWAVLYFLSYLLLAAFIIVNVFIGIVLNAMEEAREEGRRAEADADDSPPPSREEIDARIQELQELLRRYQG